MPSLSKILRLQKESNLGFVPVVYPVSHRDGTPREVLLDGYAAAIDAVKDAIAAVKIRVLVVERDWATVLSGPGFKEATKQQEARLEALEKVRKELEMIYIRVKAQI
jgi:hypothetical protein